MYILTLKSFIQWVTPLLPLCLLNLEDPALQVDQEVQDVLSPQQDQSLQSGPEMSHISDKNVIQKQFKYNCKMIEDALTDS